MSLGLVASYGSSDEDSENSDVDDPPKSKDVVAGSGSGNQKNDQQQQHEEQLAKTTAASSSSIESSDSRKVNSKESDGTVNDISDEEDAVSSSTMGSVRRHDIPNPTTSLTGQISDEEEDVGPAGPAKFSIIAGLPAPKNAPVENVDLSFSMPTRLKKIPEAEKSTSSSLLSGLPAPRPSSSATLAGYEEDEVEEEYKKKPVKAELPVPKKRQPVKITVPSLAELDSDEEEDGPRVKKPRRTGGGVSGLLSMLPTPKQMAVKEKGRALIPHTLTKRPAPKATSVKRPARSVVGTSKLEGTRNLPGVSDNIESDSDEEAASVDFFSFSGNEAKSASASNMESLDDLPQPNPRLFSEVSSKRISLPGAKADSPHPSSSMATSSSQMKSKDKATVSGFQDITVSSSFTGLRGPYSTGPDPAFDYNPSVSGIQAGYVQTTGAADGISGQVAEQYYDNSSGVYQPSVQQMEQMTQDEQFQRMVGKKFRGEAMHIVDVNADDQMNQVDLTKNLTEEVSGFSYSKKKNKDMPSSMERRKHQITYLAFQAKERELELKNKWAQNRQTKRQTQSKYGF